MFECKKQIQKTAGGTAGKIHIASTLVLAAGITAAFSYAAVHAISIPDVLPGALPIIHSQPQTLTISWVGDMVPTENDTYNAHVFDAVAPYIRMSDIAIGNVEGTFAGENRYPKCSLEQNGCFSFRGNESFLESLTNAGFDMVSFVNNHSLDFGKEGLEDTEAIADARALPYISQLHPTREFVVKNFHIGVLGISSSPPDHRVSDYTYIANTIADLKTRNDVVILIMHAGAEGANKTIVPGTTEYQGDENRGDVEKIAHTAIDAGADLVFGSGPHVLRKIETYRDGLIAYSLGNFEGGNGKLVTKGILGTSGILNVTISKKHARSDITVSYTFTSIALSRDGVPALDPTDAGKNLIDELSN